MPSISISALMKLLGIDPQAEEKKNALGVLNQLVGDELGYAGLELSPDQRSYQNKTRVPFFDESELTPKYTLDQEMMALAGGPPVDYGAMQLTPDQTQQAIGAGWAQDKPAPLTDDQEHSRRMARWASAMAGHDPLATLGVASEFFNPVARKDRLSKRAYMDAQTQNLLAGVEGDEGKFTFDDWLNSPRDVQEGYIRYQHGPSRVSSWIQLLDRRDRAAAAGDQNQVNAIDGLLRRVLKYDSGAGATGLYDLGTDETSDITSPEQIIDAEVKLAEETSAADVRGKEGAKAKFDWGVVREIGNNAIGIIEELIENDQALRWSTGFFGPITTVVAGTNAKVGGRLMESIKGNAFLTAAANGGKGVFPISNQDAADLKASITALGPDLPYEQAKKELDRILRLTKKIMAEKGKQAGAPQEQWQKYLDETDVTDWSDRFKEYAP